MKLQLFGRKCRAVLSAALAAAVLTCGISAHPFTEENLLYRTERTLSEGLTYEMMYTDNGLGSVSRRGYLYTYTPGASTLPYLTYGTHIYGMETTSSMAKTVQTQLAENTGRVVGGINGDFYSMQTGIPIGVMIGDGTILCSDAGAAAIGIRSDGSCLIGQPTIKTVLHRVLENEADAVPTADAEAFSLPVAHINKLPAVWGAYLCTPAFGKTTCAAENGTEYVFRTEEGRLAVGQSVTAVLAEIREDTKNTEIPEDGFVIVVHAACQAAGAYRALAVGDRVQIACTAAEGWEDVVFAVGGGDILVQNGIARNDGFSVSHAKTPNPRTAVGYTADGELKFFALDGRSETARGMTLAELAETMAGFGCIGAINLDGGGSTTVLVRADDDALTVANMPSDGRERKISNAVLFVDGAQPDGIPFGVRITPESPIVYGDAAVDFDFMVYDRAHTPLSSDGMTVTWSSDGGVIDGDGVFRSDAAAEQMSVCVQVTYPLTDAEGAETVCMLESTETVFRTRTLTGLSSDVRHLTVPGGGASAPVHVTGLWLGHPVYLDPAAVQASLTGAVSGAFVDDTLSVHLPEPMLGQPEDGFPRETLVLSVDDGQRVHTLSLPVTCGAAPDVVLTMDVLVPVTLFRMDDGGHLTRAAGAGRDGKAAVSFTASEITPCTTPAAPYPVKRMDLYLLSDTRPEGLSARLTYRGEDYTLPWVISDDFSRLGGWYRISLDTTAIDPLGIRGFTFDTMLSSDVPLTAVMDDLTYWYGDEIASFTDTAASWAYDSIEAVSRMGVVNGIANGDGTYRFAPDACLTRAEFAVMIARFLALSVPVAAEVSAFADAASIPAWAAPGIAAVTDGGYMRGKGAVDELGNMTVSFAPGDTMTRAEVLQVLGAILRAADIGDGTTGNTEFADDDRIPGWARENIALLAAYGIASGYADNTLRPGAEITRAEVVALLCRTHNVLIGQ